MSYKRIEESLATFKDFFSVPGASFSISPELEYLIVSGMVLVIISEYESMIEDLFITRASLSIDPETENYITSAFSRKFRSPSITKITEHLGKFSAKYRKNFSDNVLDSENSAAWDNIMKARHEIVHGQGSINLTFKELIDSYPKTKSILACLVGALELDPQTANL